MKLDSIIQGSRRGPSHLMVAFLVAVTGWLMILQASAAPSEADCKTMILAHARECTWVLDGTGHSGNTLWLKPYSMNVSGLKVSDTEVEFTLTIAQQKATPAATANSQSVLEQFSRAFPVNEKEWQYRGKWKIRRGGVGEFLKGGPVAGFSWKVDEAPAKYAPKPSPVRAGALSNLGAPAGAPARPAIGSFVQVPAITGRWRSADGDALLQFAADGTMKAKSGSDTQEYPGIYTYGGGALEYSIRGPKGLRQAKLRVTSITATDLVLQNVEEQQPRVYKRVTPQP